MEVALQEQVRKANDQEKELAQLEKQDFVRDGGLAVPVFIHIVSRR